MSVKGLLSSSLLLAAMLAPGPAGAQKPSASGETLEVHPEAKAAIDRIRSPYCPGMMLEVCTSAGGAMLRDSIQSMAEAGLDADSIVELIIADYGEEWRAEPLRSGTGLWAWIIPPAILLAGSAAVAVVLARRRREGAPEGPAREVAPEEDRRIREALRKLDEEEEPVF